MFNSEKEFFIKEQTLKKEEEEAIYVYNTMSGTANFSLEENF